MNRTFINVIELLNVSNNNPEIVDAIIRVFDSSILFSTKISIKSEKLKIIVFNDGVALFISNEQGAFELDFITDKDNYIPLLKKYYSTEHVEIIIDKILKHFFYPKRESES